MLDRKKTSTAYHAHHWVIEEAKGPTSPGRCVACGAVREFRNAPAEEVLHRAEYAA
ncbi:MAG: hypothetical protein AB7J35_11525 [Dehalococcoidia bacterium]